MYFALYLLSLVVGLAIMYGVTSYAFTKAGVPEEFWEFRWFRTSALITGVWAIGIAIHFISKYW